MSQLLREQSIRWAIIVIFGLLLFKPWLPVMWFELGWLLSFVVFTIGFVRLPVAASLLAATVVVIGIFLWREPLLKAPNDLLTLALTVSVWALVLLGLVLLLPLLFRRRS